jgi:hypothetical protein
MQRRPVCILHSTICTGFQRPHLLVYVLLQDRRTLRPGNGSPLEKARNPAAGSCDGSSCYGGDTTTASTPSRLVQDM